MTLDTITTGLLERSAGTCELCNADSDLFAVTISPKVGRDDSERIAVCRICADASASTDQNAAYWRCLTDSIWSQVPAVQVACYRLLSDLPKEEWAQDLLSMMYMDDETSEWAHESAGSAVVHKDINGQVLTTGDTVVLVKDLQVKGAGFTAKRGTPVRRITLVRDHADQIEGRVNDQHIVILTQYVKKA